MKELILLDYRCHKVNTGIDLNKLDDILRIDIEVLSGDEVACIVYKNGDIMRFDSNDDRMLDFNDGSWCIYQAGVKNEIDNWLKRDDREEYRP